MASRSFEIRAVMSDLKKFTTRVVQKITLSVNGVLVKTTPRDTSWARNNWIPEIGHAYSGTAGTREAAEQGSIDTGSREAGVVKVLTIYSINNGPIYITNNVPYIGDLNDGSSKQAPAGFVQLSIAKGIENVRGIVGRGQSDILR